MSVHHRFWHVGEDIVRGSKLCDKKTWFLKASFSRKDYER